MARRSRKPSSLARLRQRVARFLLQDLWSRDRAETSRLHPFFVHNIRLIFLLVRGFREHQCTTRAAALTFTTVVALVPFLAAGLSVMHGFGELEPYEDQVIDFVAERFMPPVGPSGSAGVPGEAGEAGPTNRRQFIREKIKAFTDNVQYGKIGALASAFCLVIFLHLLAAVEAAFNHIWGVKRPRTFLQKVRAYWMLAIVPLLIAGYVASVGAIGGRLAAHPNLARLFTLLSDLVFVWLVFLAVYWLLPNTPVNFSAAAVAAAFSAILLQFLKQSTLLVTWLFGHRADTLAEIYGASVAMVPLFLFVVFVLWLVTLFGAELSYAAQNVRAYARDRRTLALNPASREALGLRLLLEVAACFHRARPAPSTAGLSDQFDVSLLLVRDTLELFEGAGLVRRTGEESDPGWQPARPLDRITTAEARACLRRATGDDLRLETAEPLGRYLSERLERAEQGAATAFGESNLREVLDRAGSGADQGE